MTEHSSSRSQSRLAKNTAYNFSSLVLPGIVAVLAMPVIISRFGVERFGLLGLIWVVIGYFSVFDFGFGRAVTRAVAERLGAGKIDDMNALVWSAWSVMALVGVSGGLLAFVVVPWVVIDVVRTPGWLLAEARASGMLTAAMVPLVIVSTGLRGVLEANQRFGRIALVRTPVGVATFAVPLVVSFFAEGLVPVVILLGAVRGAAILAYFVMCLRVGSGIGRPVLPDKTHVWALFRFGGWVTVSNVVSPIMVMSDRFFVGSLVSLAAVAYYTTPFEVVTKLLLIPSAISTVMFPAFAAEVARTGGDVSPYYRNALRAIYVLTLPVCAGLIAFAPELLSLWLDETFAAESTVVTRWLAAGIFANAVAFVPFALVQGVGRADITAKLHLLELPLYLLVLVVSVKLAGIAGAAIAWAVRATADMLALHRAGVVVNQRVAGILRADAWVPIVAVLTWGAMVLSASLLVRAGMFLLTLALVAYAAKVWAGDAWRIVHEPAG